MRESGPDALLARPWGRVLAGLIVPVLLLGWWQHQAVAGGPRSDAFTPLGRIGASFLALLRDGTLVTGTLATVSRSITGLLIGGVAGIALGVAMAVWRPLDRLLGSSFDAMRHVPLIGWLPLVGLWFGTGQASELAIIGLSAFFPTLLHSHEGIAQVERRYIEVGRVYGFTPGQRFRYVLLPAAMPMILTGITQALAFTWIAAVGSEILMGNGEGLGVMMETAQTQQRMDVILAVIVATAIVGFVLNQLLVRLRRYALRWQGASL